MQKIIVTGGCGYIGSHTVVELQQKGYQVVILDDLSNSTQSVLDGIQQITGIKPLFEKVDLKDPVATDRFFCSHQDAKGIIHFAASKAVGQSMQEPLMYYQNNIIGIINLLQGVKKYNLNNLIFSSSCTVYGQADKMPITELAPIKQALSPYGNTKQIGEQIIVDLAQIYPLKSVLLRYFNPIGAHDSLCIGESVQGVPYNLIPYLTQTAKGIRPYLSVYGDSYNTPDGTCIRDYIHVQDLAVAHLKALELLLKNQNKQDIEVFNLGSGKGYSVLELIESFKRVNKVDLAYKIVQKRPGDVDAAWADTTKAYEQLNWQPTKDLDQMLASAWAWENKNQN
ncbi:UDP-glucose 4-epimerase GalE [Myroides sp. LJL110]